MDAAKHRTAQRRQQQMERQLPLVCKSYNRREGCSRYLECQELHLCFDFLLNRCSTARCVKAHGLDTPRNIVVLQRMGWCGPGDMRLALDGLRRRAHGHVVSVCLAYTLGCCPAAGCGRLHVCYRHVLDSCPLDDCALSHDVLNGQHNAALLAGAGLADTPISELLRRLRDQLRRRPPQPFVCRAANSRPGGCQRHCLRPHYCEALALGRCRYGDRCFKSHSLQDPHNRRVLRFFDWTEKHVLDALSTVNGQQVRQSANPEARADRGDREEDDKSDGRAPELELGRIRHGETEAGAGATARVKGSDNGGSQGNRTERSSEKNAKDPKGHCQISTQRVLQQTQQDSEAMRRLETERQEWLKKEKAWQQKENEWQEKQRTQMKEQAERQKEWETQDRAREEREDQTRAARERERQEREREKEKHDKEMSEKEAQAKELLEKNTELRNNYSSSEKTIIALNGMIAELDQQLASLRVLLQEAEAREQQKTMDLCRGHEQEQKRKLDELSKLQEQISRQREWMECNICFEIFVEPLTLGCAHTFCKACIERLRRRAINQAMGMYHPTHGQFTQCPICRRVTTTAVPSLALKNIASWFQDAQYPEQPTGAAALV